MSDDLRHMAHALRLAERAQGRTRPNPVVGCVIVRAGRVVGRGFHHRAGLPHAEPEALRQAGELARGATVYVTLEPCSHSGRTPPCADALIKAGVAQVVVATLDPNPLVAGQGVARLRAAGLGVRVGVLETEACALNAPFFSWVTRHRPWVTLKIAASLDGRIATKSGESQWITGSPARRLVHRMRDRNDAVLTGIGTVLADDPQLTCRNPGGRDPVRVVVDSRLRVPLEARIFTASATAPVWLATTEAGVERSQPYLERYGSQVAVLVCRSDERGRVDVRDLLTQLAQREITSLLVEAGGQMNGAFIDQRLADRLALFLAPKLIGSQEAPGFHAGVGCAGLGQVPRLQGMRTTMVGEDLLIEGAMLYSGS